MLLKAFLRQTHARTGWSLAGVASFCLTGAIVLGVIQGPRRHGAELAPDTAAPELQSGQDRTFAEVLGVSAAATASSPVTPSPVEAQSDRPESERGPVQSVEFKPVIAKVSTGATPLPPTRPRELSPRMRLASMHQPIEFKLADRGGNR